MKGETMEKKYDEEIREHYELEMYDVEDVAENGEQASSIRKAYFDNLPPMDKIEEVIKGNGCDTFEITHVTEKIIRYNV